MIRTATLAALLFAATALNAHHSTAPFDMTKAVTVTGKVAEFRWANPHSYIILDGVEEGADGVTRHWTIEIEALNLLRRYGWTKESVKPGDQVSCTGARAKLPDLYAQKCFTLKFADGRELIATPTAPPSGR